jgi:hypothetical protein
MKKLIWLWMFVLSMFFVGEALAATHYIISPKDTNGGAPGALDAYECEDIRGDNSDWDILDESIAIVVVEGANGAPGIVSIWKFVDDVDDTNCIGANDPWDCCTGGGAGDCEFGDGDTDFMIFPDDQDECDTADEGAWIKIEGLELARSTEPQIVFRDIDNAVADENAKIQVQCTDPGDGTEDCDIYFCVQEAGSDISGDPCGDWKIHIDADGNIILAAVLEIDGLTSLTPVTDDCDDFAAEFTGANLYGGTFICNLAGICVLPVMQVGMNFTIITMGDIECVIDPNIADGSLVDGTTSAEGKKATNLSLAGDIAVVQYYDASDWLITTNGWTLEP